MSRRAAADALCAHALALRAWALRVLAGDGAAPPPSAPGEAWRLFLDVERCARPVAARLSVPLAGDARAAMDTATLRETRRVLAARAQLRAVGRVAAAHGWRVAALKGGVSAAATPGTALDVADVDLLAGDAERAALSAALVTEAGYTAYGGAALWHDAPLLAPGGIQVEVHHRVEGMDAPAAALLSSALPLDGAPGLLRLDDGAHRRHVLLHAASQHLHKRGSLRDLVLLAEALEGGGDGAVAALAAETAGHPHAGAIRAHLAMAAALAAGRAPDDPFRATAAGAYLLGAGEGALHRGVGATALAMAVFVALEGPREWRRGWAELGEASRLPSWSPTLARLEAAAPWLGRPARYALRGVRYAGALLLAAPLARRARRLAAA